MIIKSFLRSFEDKYLCEIFFAGPEDLQRFLPNIFRGCDFLRCKNFTKTFGTFSEEIFKISFRDRCEIFCVEGNNIFERVLEVLDVRSCVIWVHILNLKKVYFATEGGMY